MGRAKVGGAGWMRRVYRWPVDRLEEWTTGTLYAYCRRARSLSWTGIATTNLGQSDVILSNSKFTSRVYARSFPTLANRPPRVVYPCINVDAYQGHSAKGKGKAKERGEGVDLISTWVMAVSADSFQCQCKTDANDAISDRPTLISLNRFEAKKNVALAITAFARVLSYEPEKKASLRLVIAGMARLSDQQHADSFFQVAMMKISRTMSILSRPCRASATSSTFLNIPLHLQPLLMYPRHECYSCLISPPRSAPTSSLHRTHSPSSTLLPTSTLASSL